ncbi:TPA: lipoyl(octanoyl) transferase LipB, partial [Klebsiella pneumoniae]|nr:lipoyl(octanoyl) transferase LipB [Klebsiella pneumoniae]
MSDSVRIKWFERPSAYEPIWQAMRDFTEQRGPETPDEIWLVEHTPVYTQGQAGKPEHLLNPGGIPVVQTDRGGQITYHGPGQLMVYCLFDLRRVGLYVKEYVRLLEEAVIACLTHFGVEGACCKPGAPGVYVPQGATNQELAKISALGIKIRNGRSYHGLALNIGMD